MIKLAIAVLLICVSLALISCGNRELREEYYDSSNYGANSFYSPWNDPGNWSVSP
ncbi:hypothetical protein ACFL4N_02235 [Thermodesulfobacteriota bacterium]